MHQNLYYFILLWECFFTLLSYSWKNLTHQSYMHTIRDMKHIKVDINGTILPRIQVRALIYETAHFCNWLGVFVYKAPQTGPRHFSTIFNIIRQYSTSCNNVLHYSAIFDIIRQYSTLFDIIRDFLAIFNILRQ